MFRHCDLEQKGFVKTVDFSKFLQGIKHGLSKTRVQRFILLIDEDNTGIIQQHDYYQTLEAYKILTIKPQTQGRPFEQQCLFKLGALLIQKRIHPENAFGLCDQYGTK